MRLTMRNHKSYTYRASLIRVDNNCAIGDIVDKLGKYEDICDDPERLKEIVKEKSKEISGSNPLLRLDKSIKFE